ncbi:alkaline phosphatase D family protein [Sphingomonas sp. R-74633]|uniref:alkaline phosphatase D family protein n=1 Tax=Sphingomonas sp. R-74633 TaxID=2751188 RepID=UPI0015D350A9|nr:alkaline phosphatase D family protein [Sphingomonas sp. R-74633]NYT40769.1 alkaline phosphatase D family protein [Sphingomonas sp. R-74633]
MTLVLDRRKLLAGAGSLALFSGLAPVSWAAPKFSRYPFSLGVAAGDPWPDGFVIWTRLAPEPLAEHGGMPMAAVPVRWEVAEDARFARIVQSGAAVARPELGHSVHVELGGLKPARPYWYRFLVEGAEASPVGTARTAPAAGATVDRLRLAVAGCQAYPQGWYEAWRHISQEPDLDAVFHYGDYIYESAMHPATKNMLIRDAGGSIVSRDHFGDEIYSVDDYRRRYAQYKSDPDLQAAHAAAAFVMSFDDHEVDNNWASRFDQDGTPPEAFLLRRFAAMQAWYENVPVRRAQMPGPGGITMYRRLDFGGLLRMHVLDTRSYRDDQPCEKPGETACRTTSGPETTIMGKAQEAWLDQGFASKARWNLVAQQVFVMPLYVTAADGTRQLRPGPDNWSGYPAARARLVRSIARHKLSNVVIATGDAHIHAVGTVPMRDDAPDGPAAAVEFLATSITSGGDGTPGETPRHKTLRAASPNVALLNDQRGYQLFDITAKEWRTDVKVMDQVQAPGGAISSLARFAVEPNRPMLHRL